MIANKEGAMPEREAKTEYFDKYLDARFQHIDESMNTLKNMFVELRQEVKQENETTRREVKADNKATRWWIIGTGIAVIFGIAAIFFSFAQIQTSWMQQVISFAMKAIK